MNRLFTATLTIFLTLSAQAQEIDPSEAPGEFFFNEIEGKKGGPNAFLSAHAARQALPGSIDNSFRAQAAEKAWKSFDEIRFRGLSKGRKGVWQTVGPVHEQTDEPFAWKSTSGRVTDLAIGKSCNDNKCRLYAATAGGGLWRTDKALHPDNPGWEHLSNGLLSNNIGSIEMDPNDASGSTLYIGTGEGNFSFTSMAGKGVFKSTDGGDSFNKLPTMILDEDISPDPIDFTATRGVAQVAVKPGSPGTIHVATTTASQGMTAVRGGQSTLTGGPQAKVGLYQTTDGGTSWSLLFEAPIKTFSSSGTHEGIFQFISGVKDVQIDPLNTGTVWISVADDGVYRSAPALEGADTSFKKVFEIVGFTRDDSYAAFDMTIKDGKTRVYLYNGNGVDTGTQALYRLDDAGVPALALYDGAANTAAWVNKTVLDSWAAYVDWVLCGGQCVYDQVVATPPGLPDTVYAAGNLSASLSDATVRSTDGGENFQSLAIDVQEPPRRPHVDVRAITFSPENPDIVFVGSDGGVVRTNGVFADATGSCETVFGAGSARDSICKEGWQVVPEELVFMNRGLLTMQLFNISADPNRPLKRMMAGTQDNSTQWHDGTHGAKNWSQVLGVGDGTSANGFHREDPNILFASFQSTHFFTNFNGQSGNDNWLYTSGPITFSGETAYPNEPPGSGRQFITFDPKDADTQFTGYEHIWRTQNNGGDRSTLETLGCRLTQNWFQLECGDWEALGENLVNDADFGADRAGGVISAAERSSGDTGTLWAGTSLGRLFITRNSDAAAGTVTFDRLDSPTTPPRFVSGIAVDADNPNRAFVSYSGFTAVTPAGPGHVFEVVYDPGMGTAVFTSMDHNLGDIPINHLVRDDHNGDLYAATDFGVLILPAGASAWEDSGAGLPAVLTPHLEIHSAKRMLFAATHGMGAWYMNLSKK
jgi:hypothetical protein